MPEIHYDKAFLDSLKSQKPSSQQIGTAKIVDGKSSYKVGKVFNQNGQLVVKLFLGLLGMKTIIIDLEEKDKEN